MQSLGQLSQSSPVSQRPSPSQREGVQNPSTQTSPGTHTESGAGLLESDHPAAEAASENGLFEVSSPIVGTFFRSPGPDAPRFVEVGASVAKGQVLCIIEAMKVMNEIESEIDAEVVEVTVANGQPVEYGEVLFRLRPLG